MKKHILLLLLCANILMTCSNNPERPDISTTATFSIQLYDEFPKTNHGNLLTMTDAGGTTFTIEDALVNVRHVEFGLPDGVADSVSHLSFNGPFVMDLEDIESTPRIEEFDMAEGLYHWVKVRFDDAKADDGLVSTGDELLDNTMVIKGTFDYNDKKDRNFTFIFKFNEDIIFEKATGFRIREGEKNNIIIALQIDEWLKNINITECLDSSNILLDENGDLLIDENNGNGDCSDFKETLKSNIISLYSLNSL